MAINNRLRWEILRRDNFRCAYCHREMPLTIDHIKPKSLGGNDDPTNLVACCEECNSGKTSTLPGGATIDGPEGDLIRWTRAMKRAAYLAREKQDEIDHYRENFKAAWDRWRTKDRETVRLPADWGRSLDSFYAADLPDWIWTPIIEQAMGGHVVGDRFKHACALAWKKVAALQKQARLDASGNITLDWGKAEKEAVMAAADFVWRSSWMAAHGEDPAADDAAEARARACALYPEILSAGDLLTAMEASAEYRINDLEDALEHERTLYDEEPWTPDRYFETWMKEWQSAGDDVPDPTTEERASFQRHAEAASTAGYDGVMIGCAAHHAGRSHSPLLLDFLESPRDILALKEREDHEAAQTIGRGGYEWLKAFAASGERATEPEFHQFIESLHPWALRVPIEEIGSAAAEAGSKRALDITPFLPATAIAQEVPF